MNDQRKKQFFDDLNTAKSICRLYSCDGSKPTIINRGVHTGIVYKEQFKAKTILIFQFQSRGLTK